MSTTSDPSRSWGLKASCFLLHLGQQDEHAPIKRTHVVWAPLDLNLQVHITKIPTCVIFGLQVLVPKGGKKKPAFLF